MLIGLFAINNKNGIGHNGSMPWPANKDDLRWFKKNTTNHIVVMGRSTWDSPDMPSPLPNRLNVVFTTRHIDNPDIIQYSGDICENILSLSLQYPYEDIFIIGGANMLEQSFHILDKLLITRIDDNTDCDTILNIDNHLTNFQLDNTISFGNCTIEEWVSCRII